MVGPAAACQLAVAQELSRKLKHIWRMMEKLTDAFFSTARTWDVCVVALGICLFVVLHCRGCLLIIRILDFLWACTPHPHQFLGDQPSRGRAGARYSGGCNDGDGLRPVVDAEAPISTRRPLRHIIST